VISGDVSGSRKLNDLLDSSRVSPSDNLTVVGDDSMVAGSDDAVAPTNGNSTNGNKFLPRGDSSHLLLASANHFRDAFS
jgi:hypothetical protein